MRAKVKTKPAETPDDTPSTTATQPSTWSVTYEFKFLPLSSCRGFGASSPPRLDYVWESGSEGTGWVRDTTTRRLDTEGKTVPIKVPDGHSVRLFLNSDASGGFFSYPVFEFTPNGEDAKITITETSEKADADPKLQGRSGKMNGDLWMKVSHQYTEAEVRDLLRAAHAEAGGGWPHQIDRAVLSAYGPLKGTGMLTTEPQFRLGDPDPINMVFQGFDPKTGARTEDGNHVDDNAHKFIPNWDFFRHGLPRVHPWALLAMFIAAWEAKVDEVEINSGWRPILGAIGHRNGLGLDVISLTGTLKLNTGAPLYLEYFPKWKVHVNATKVVDPHRGEKLDLINRFRESLYAQKNLVKQVFDPWKMEEDTNDGRVPLDNSNRPGNERAHRDHLHVTARHGKAKPLDILDLVRLSRLAGLA